MGRITGRSRKPRGLLTDTLAALTRAFAQDFANSRNAPDARDRLRHRGQRLTDVAKLYETRMARASEALKLLTTGTSAGWIDDEFFPFSRYVAGGRLTTASTRLQDILDGDRTFRTALRRQRGQPAKYAWLDAAIVEAVRTGESPAEVVAAAIRITGSRPTARLKERFLDRLKKKRRTHSVE